MRRTVALSLCALAALALLVGTSPLQSQDKDKPELKPAKLKVLLPADAALEIEGAKTKKTGAVRDFESPPIASGKNYVYTLKVTLKDGRVIEHEVKGIQPGQETVVDLNQVIAKKETKPATTAEKPVTKPEKKPVVTEKKPVAKEEKPKEEKKPTRGPDVVFVPTPQEVVDRMLELAEVKKTDLVYDLGCGNGIIVVTAAKKYGVKAVGFDIDPERIQESNENVKKNKVEDLVTIKHADIFEQDLSKANVITLYLLPSLNVKLIPQLEKCKPGTRIVSHDFDMRGVKPKKVETVKTADGREKTVYLWVTPLEKEKD